MPTANPTTPNLWPKYSSRLSGAWKCISFEQRHAQTHDLLTKPHGDTPLGRVLISPQGFLSAHVANPQRLAQPLPSGKAWQTGGDAEVAHVARGLSMYCGYMEVYEDEAGLWWRTKVEVSSDPARMGGYEVRRVELIQEGGREVMVLRPERDMVLEDGTKARGELKWVRFE
ncbi:Lipocalin-like domain-containing protein [Neohortaea acidophila]|uniref:Lipocalin-like domain-containing protein n=1 Tax=Neohortaea acidophila TaxID=245834 RepID=A0A6A6PVM7_9PEZI|nr:Lipocalin-like domain-containing protein [Neohortaea acidophila]KAF2484082.1 Lipocalin-like domain-containing protein [Neohortaea acidophila]